MFASVATADRWSPLALSTKGRRSIVSMTDAVITEQGEPVVIELLYMRHRNPELAEVDSVDGALRET